LWKQYLAQRDDVPRNQLVAHYLPLVHYRANKLHAKLYGQAELSDLVSWGVIGMMQAIAHFKIRQGVKFSTYAAPRLLGAMLDGIRAFDHVARRVRDRTKSTEAARAVASSRLGRRATDEETADQLGMCDAAFVAQLRESIAIGQRSLSEPAGCETESGRILEQSHVVQSTGDDPTRSSQTRDLLALVTRDCTKDERIILICYYYEHLTMAEIGLHINLTVSRVSQMHSALIRRLQASLNRRVDEFQ